VFIVKWILREEGDPCQVEESPLRDTEELFAHCQGRLLGAQTLNMRTAPVGFMICDEQGNVLRRTLDKPPPLDWNVAKPT
jgi:hypothetical protein